MARILYLNPIGSDLFNDYFFRQIRNKINTGTELTVTHLELEKDQLSPFLPPLPFYQGELFQKMLEAEAEGYDGIIIGCSADPGLFEAKRMLNIPVTAPFEANLHLASAYGARLTIFTPGMADAGDRYMALARLYGLEHRIASVITVDMGYPSTEELAEIIRTEPKTAVNVIIDCHRRVIKDLIPELAGKDICLYGTGLFYLGCTFWTGMAAELSTLLKLPVLDPVFGPIRLIESLVDFSAKK